jgi:hypothetical protein
MTREEITSLVTALGDLMQVLRDADPADKAEVYCQLGLTLTYHPEDKRVIAEARPETIMYVGKVSEVRVATYVHVPDCPDHGVPSRRRGCRTVTCPTGSEPPGVLAKNAKD